MLLSGTTFARPSRMNDLPQSLVPALLAEEPAQPEDERRLDDGDEIDKYDISTLACTD